MVLGMVMMITIMMIMIIIVAVFEDAPFGQQSGCQWCWGW